MFFLRSVYCGQRKHPTAIITITPITCVIIPRGLWFLITCIDRTDPVIASNIEKTLTPKSSDPIPDSGKK